MISNKTKEKIQQRRKCLIELLGGKCWDCGSKEELHFHHTNSEEKYFTLSGTRLLYSWERLVDEAEKCILLCKDCHKKDLRGHHILQHGRAAYRAKRCVCGVCHQAYKEYYTKYNRSLGMSERKTKQHGDRAMYSSGCRCYDCMRANSDYSYKHRKGLL